MINKPKTQVPPVLCENCKNWPNVVWCLLTPEQYEEFIATKHFKVFEKGEYLFRAGTSPTYLYSIYTGKVKVVKEENGEHTIVRLARDGDLVGYRAVLAGEPYSASAIAIERTSACVIPVKTIKKFLRENAELDRMFLKILAEDLRRAESRLQFMASHTVKERILHTLIFMESFFGKDAEGYINIPLSRTELAQLVGTALETLIRQLKILEQEGLIEIASKNRIKLIDKELIVNTLSIVD